MISLLVRRLGRLGVRLWVPFLLLAIGSLVAGAAALYAAYTDQRHHVASLQEEVVARASVRVSDYLQDIENSMVAGAQALSVVDDDPTAQQRYLRSLLDANPALTELSLIDPAGRETAKVNRQRSATEQDLLDQSGSDKFLSASQGQTYFGSVQISESAMPSYALTVPIYGDVGLVMGALAAEVNFDEVWGAVASIPVGRAGYVYLVDGKGNLIAHHDRDLVMQQSRASQHVLGVQRFLAGDFEVLEYQGLNGQTVIGARQPIAGTDWGVITELPAREAYRTANFFVLTSALIFLALLAVVLSMGWFINRRVIQPLVALCQGVAIFGRGNLNYRIEVDASDEIEELATEFNTMAASLQQSRAETQDRLREVSSLVEAGRAITSLDLQRVLGTLAQEAARAVESQACIIYILNEPSQRLEPKSVWSWPGIECGPTPQLVGEGVAGWIAEHAQTLRVEDIHSDPRFFGPEAVCAYRSLLGLPLSVSGRLVGVLVVSDKIGGEGGFTADDERLLLAFGDQAAVSIENAELYGEERRRSRELAVVNRISRAITSSLDPETTLDAILASVRDLLPYVAAEICLWDSDKNVLVSRGWGGESDYRHLTAGEYAPDEGYTGWIAHHQEPLLIPDINTFDEVKPMVASTELPSGSYVGVPLLVGNTFVGTLELISDEPNTYQPQDLDTLQTVANQAAIAIENARLFAATERNMREASILYQTTSALSSKLSVDELLNDLARRMELALGADECAISEWDEASGVLWTVTREQPANSTNLASSRANISATMLIRDEPYLVADFPATAEVLRGQRPTVVLASDPEADPAEIELLRELGWRSVLMLPLVTRDAVVGLVEIFDTQERHFADEEIRLAQALTSQAAIALHNAQLFSLTDERLRKRIKELAGLQQVSQELNSTLDQDRILQLALEEAVRATGADFGNVNLHDSDTGQLLAYATFGFDDEELTRLEQIQFNSETGVMGRVLQTREPVLVPDVTLDPHYVRVSSQSRSEVAVPIFYAGDVAGVINLESRQFNAFSEEQLDYLQALANQAAVAIRNAMAYEEQQQQRELLRQRAEQLARLSEISHAFRSDQQFESVLEDIAYAINETLGFNLVLINVMRGDPPALHAAAAAGIPLVEMERLKTTSPAPEVVMDLMQDRFRLGHQFYYIPHTQKQVWTNRLERFYTQPECTPAPDGRCWNMGDLCFSPLYDSERQFTGLIFVDNPRDGRVPAGQVVDMLELFANQAAAIIENARLHVETQKRLQEQIALRKAGAVISSKLGLPEVLSHIAEQMTEAVGATSGYICSLDRRARTSNVLAEYIGPHACEREKESDLGVTYQEIDYRFLEPLLSGQPWLDQLDDPDLPAQDRRDMERYGAQSILFVPLYVRGHTIGYAELWESRRRREFTPEEISLCQDIAQQAAIALENAQFYEQVRRHADRLRVINEVGVEITSILNVDQLIARVSQLVEDNFGYHANIALIEEDYLIWRTGSDQEDERDQKDIEGAAHHRGVGDRGITGWAIESGQTVVIPDAAQDPHYAPSLGREGSLPEGITHSEIAIPLKVHDHIIGVFDIKNERFESFNQNDVLVLQSLANHAAVAIANAQLFERVSQLGHELEQRVQERTEALANTLEDLTLERDRVETLYQITSELSASLDLDRVLSEALSLINRAVGVSHGSIMLLNRGTGELIYRAALGRSKGLPRGGKITRYRRGVGLAGWVLETREAVIVPDVTQDSRWLPNESKSIPERKSAMAIPLSAGEDVLGVLLLFHPEVDYFTADHLKLVSAAAAQVATAINNAELYQLITDQAERLGVMLRSQRAEAAKLQAILEGIADGVLVLDFNRHVMLMNPATARILGLDAGDFEGQHLREILGRAEATIDQLLAQQLYDQLMTGMKQIPPYDPMQVGDGFSFGFRLEAEDKVVVVNLVPASLGGGELPSLVIVLRDISREAEVERLKNEFISTVSHELRTPMTSIKGFTDLLVSQRVGDLSEQQRRFVQIIKNNADRLTAMVNDILDISRIETGRIKLQFESLDLIKLINDVADNFRGQMVAKSLDLILDLPPSLPPVRADEDRVTQILENLTSNAWKYTPEGGQVTIRANLVDGFVQVDVTDTGYGIEERDLPYIFDRFYRTEKAEVQAVDGSGLGLSIVKMFVGLLGGKVWAESEVESGSTFSFTLPLAAETLMVSSDEGMTGPKVLVVEDDEHILQLLRHQLETEGYQVLTARRGQDVFQLAQREQPVLITLDILLVDDVDGFVVLERLKNDPTTSNIPVIVVSVVPDAQTRGLALGAAGYIGKPFDENQVLSEVHKVMASLGVYQNRQLNQVLVVDDDRHIVDWLKRALAASGFVVQGAYNGQRALALARDISPDLILLDLKMPDMDGYDVIRSLRREEATRNIPVIVITGAPLDDLHKRVEILGMGVEQLLTKPFSIETLVEEIKRVESGVADWV